MSKTKKMIPNKFLGRIRKATYTRISSHAIEFHEDSDLTQHLDEFFTKNGVIPFKEKNGLEIPFSPSNFYDTSYREFSGETDAHRIRISSQNSNVIDVLLEFFLSKGFSACRIDHNTMKIDYL